MNDKIMGIIPPAKPVTAEVSPDVEALLGLATQNKDTDLKSRQERVLLEKQLHPEKELFAIELLAEHYDLKTDFGQDDCSPGRLEQLEQQYYLDTPHLKTLKEFAEYRRTLDEQSGG